jgi:hypothetical protein
LELNEKILSPKFEKYIHDYFADGLNKNAIARFVKETERSLCVYATNHKVELIESWSYGQRKPRTHLLITLKRIPLHYQSPDLFEDIQDIQLLVVKSNSS